MVYEKTFDSNFLKQPTFRLYNSDGSLIGHFTERNNGILVPFKGIGKISLEYGASYPNHMDSFPINKLGYDKTHKEILDLERRIFPFPDSEILSSIKEINSKIIDYLFFLRTNPIEIGERIIKNLSCKIQFSNNMTILHNNKRDDLIEDLETITGIINKLGLKPISPQRYTFELGRGPCYFTLTPGGQIINLDQMEFSHLKSQDLSMYDILPDYAEMLEAQQTLFNNAKNSEPDSFVLTNEREYKSACLELKKLYTIAGIQYMEKQKFTDPQLLKLTT